MKLVNNIDVFQLDIKSDVLEYYFPLNVPWNLRVVDKILVSFANDHEDEISPIDRSSRLLRYDEVDNLFLDIYNSDDIQILRNCTVDNIMTTNNNPVIINQQLTLNLCRFYFTSAPKIEGSILVYVMYGSKTEDYYPACKSLTVDINLLPISSISLMDIVDNYIHMQPKKVKGIYVWDEDPCFISLRSKDNRVTLNNIPTTLCRPPMSEGTAVETQINPLRLDNIDIDFLNSYVYNPIDREATIRLSILY